MKNRQRYRRKRPRYCERCGLRLVYRRRTAVYDRHTRQPAYSRSLTCVSYVLGGRSLGHDYFHPLFGGWSGGPDWADI